MKEPYDIYFHAIIQVVYQRYKDYYFSNKNAISIMATMKGKTID
jgi:hypothetical protein